MYVSAYISHQGQIFDFFAFIFTTRGPNIRNSLAAHTVAYEFEQQVYVCACVYVYVY